MSGASVSEQGITLGAFRRNKGVNHIPGQRVAVWMPCISMIEGVEWPHVFFIDSPGNGHVLCPACRVTKGTACSRPCCEGLTTEAVGTAIADTVSEEVESCPIDPF